MYIYLVKGFNIGFQEKYQGQKDENQKIKKLVFTLLKEIFSVDVHSEFFMSMFDLLLSLNSQPLCCAVELNLLIL